MRGEEYGKRKDLEVEGSCEVDEASFSIHLLS